MDKHNRFSTLLGQLMSTAEVKNYTIAQALQYDVSYISKWITGRSLPTERRKEDIIKGISSYLALFASEKGQEKLFKDYEVDNVEDLASAMCDHLEAAYDYVKKMENDRTMNKSPHVSYYVELTMAVYISKMRHPVLRRVNALDIMAAIDILEMSKEYRQEIVQLDSGHFPNNHFYSNVHFSLLLNLDISKWDYIHDTIFLMNLMTNSAHVSFSLYGSWQAAGKIIFSVKNDFAISGMLLGNNRCLSVAVSEDAENSNVLYDAVKEMCSTSDLLFRQTNIVNMFQSHEYAFSLLSPNLRWFLGHMTEHFLPDDLYEEIVDMLSETAESKVSKEELRNIHNLNQNIMKESHVQIILFESALSDFAVLKELDFYNKKVQLSAAQRVRYLEHLLYLCEHNKNISMKLVYGRMVSDFQYISNQCVFLSDAMSYLRLDSGSEESNIAVINTLEMQDVFDHFYEKMWRTTKNAVISDTSAISSYIQHVMQGIRMFSDGDHTTEK